jgi:hypothetical protein
VIAPGELGTLKVTMPDQDRGPRTLPELGEGRG